MAEPIVCANRQGEWAHCRDRSVIELSPREVRYREWLQEMAQKVITDDEPETRLKRFLYVGKEYNNYQPGNWFTHNYFLVRNVPSIEELAGNEEKQLIPIEIIKTAFESNLIPHTETLVFALAVCCRQTKSEKLRHAAYESIRQICASLQNFILFIRFASKLNREKEINYITQGWGHGLRKAVNNWYLSHEPLDLAKCVTRCRSKYGWKHKDILKLSHPVPNSPEKRVLLKYIILGIEKTRLFTEQFLSELEEDDNRKSEIISNVNEIMKYIQNVEDFKHCEDEVRAAALLEEYNLTLDHVPGHLLKSKKVWNSLILSMDISTLLDNLQRIHNLKIFQSDAQDVSAVERVTDLLGSAELIAQSNLHPVSFFIAVKNYRNKGKPMSHEKRKVVVTAKKFVSMPPDPNLNIIDALGKAFELSFSNIQPMKLRYLVTISTNKAMNSNAWPVQSSNVLGVEAGCFIAFMLLRSEEEVTVATFKKVGICVLDFDSSIPFDVFMERIRELPSGNTRLSKPILWALKQKRVYDVFINVVDQVNEKYDDSQEALLDYRQQMEYPSTKLINCSVCSSSTYRKEKCDKNVLTINGFDTTIPIVIQAFVQSLF